MGLGRRVRFFRLSGPAAQHIIGKRRTALGIDRETEFRSTPQDVVEFHRPFFRHHPIDYGGIELTAEIPPKIRLFAGRIADRPRSLSVTPRDRAATINRMPDNRRPTHRRNTRSHPPHRSRSMSLDDELSLSGGSRMNERMDLESFNIGPICVTTTEPINSFCSTVNTRGLTNFDLFDDLEGINFCDCNGCGCRFSSHLQ